MKMRNGHGYHWYIIQYRDFFKVMVALSGWLMEGAE